MMYDTLAAGEIKNDIDVKVYTNSSEGRAKTNLRVASMNNTSLRDSINVYVQVQTGCEENSNVLNPPQTTSIYSVIPNPFEDKTMICLKCKIQVDNALLNIYNAEGRMIRKYEIGDMKPGITSMTWDGLDATGIQMPAGAYFCKFTTSDNMSIQKIIRVR